MLRLRGLLWLLRGGIGLLCDGCGFRGRGLLKRWGWYRWFGVLRRGLYRFDCTVAGSGIGAFGDVWGTVGGVRGSAVYSRFRGAIVYGLGGFGWRNFIEGNITGSDGGGFRSSCGFF